jgi:hypothetical protein
MPGRGHNDGHHGGGTYTISPEPVIYPSTIDLSDIKQKYDNLQEQIKMYNEQLVLYQSLKVFEDKDKSNLDDIFTNIEA